MPKGHSMNTAQLISLLKNNDATLDREVILFDREAGLTLTVTDILGSGEKTLVLTVATK